MSRYETFEIDTNEDVIKEEQNCKIDMNEIEEKLDASKSRIEVKCETKLARNKKKKYLRNS